MQRFTGLVFGFALLLALAPARHGLAQGGSILEAATVLGAPTTMQPSISRFLTYNTPRAFAIGPNGASGWQSGGGDAAFVEQRAIGFCERRAGPGNCAVELRDLAIVRPGREWAPAPPPANIGISSMAHDTVPDNRFLWWGPQQARGVLVFAHGKGERASRGMGMDDARGSQPQGWTRHFNNAGYDVWRFDRHPNSDDTARAAGWLRSDLAELRRRGYRHIIVAGQSRGGWNAIMVLDRPGLADVVIAIAAAAHGRGADARNDSQWQQISQLEAILTAGQASSQARVAAANFRDDPFDAEPDRRAALLRQYGQRFAGFLLIDRPEGLIGHSAGASIAFNDRYGACLLNFATAARPPSSC
ncbi:MAG: alpha/beta hydrolase [Roseomonas sp.]|nr:alpha/beta hydrolase [Roseomonas sp.]